MTRSERLIKILGVKRVVRSEWIKNIDLLIQPTPNQLNKDMKKNKKMV